MGLPRIFVLALMLARFDALAAGGAAQPRPGDVPPADLGRTLDGTPVNLADRRGKVVVLTFWARGELVRPLPQGAACARPPAAGGGSRAPGGDRGQREGTAPPI